MQITVLLVALLIATPAFLAVPVKIKVSSFPKELKNLRQDSDTKIQVELEVAKDAVVRSEGWSLDKNHHSDEEILEFFEPTSSETIFHDLWLKSGKAKPFEAGKIFHVEYFVNVSVNNSQEEQQIKTVIPVSFAAAVSPVEIIQTTSQSDLNAVQLGKPVTINMAFKVHGKHIHNITSHSWTLDHQYHSESEMNEFLHGGNVEVSGTHLTIRPIKKYLLKAKTYHIIFSLTATNGSNPQNITFSKNVAVTFVEVHTDPNHAIKFKTLSNEEELLNVRLNQNLTVRIDFTREASDVIIRGKGWNLDSKLHSEKEANNFFLANHSKFDGHDLAIFGEKHGFLPAQYNLYFFVQYQIAGSDKNYEMRHPVKISFINIEDRVDFVVDQKVARGMEDLVSFAINKEGPTMLEYEIWFINPTTQQSHIIGAGYAGDYSVDDITFRFPVPARRSEIVPVIFKYQYQLPNSTKQEIRRAITIVRGLNFTLSALKSHMENHPREAREMISVTESIMNMALNSGMGFKSLRDSQCDQDFCANHGQCVTFAPYYKQCKCDSGFEGSRCRFQTNGDMELIAEIFRLILVRLRTTGTNTATEVIGMVRRISSVPEIFNYTLIEGELSTISVISSSISRSNNIVPQLIPAVQSILDMLNNEAHVIWDAKDEAGFKAVQQIEKRIETSLVEIARNAKFDNDMFKAMTTFAHRKQAASSIKDKLVDWLKQL